MTKDTLRRVIRQVLDDNPDEESGQALADKVMRRVDDGAARSYLAEEILGLVKDTMRTERSRRMKGVYGTASPKLDRRRSGDEPWRKRLRERWDVGADTFRLTVNLTWADLNLIGKVRREQAARNLAVADWADRCKQALTDAGVDRFGDLPTDVQAGLLSEPAPEDTP